MLPNPRQVGEPQIDHLDVLVLDRLQEIFGCRTIRNHGFTPVTERGAQKIVLPFSRAQAAWGGFWSTFHLPRRRRTGLDPAWRRSHSGTPCDARAALLPLWCGPRKSFKASSICRQVLASSTSPFPS